MSSDEPKPTILDAHAFLDWVKTQQRGDTFVYTHSGKCAVAQFLQAQHPGAGVGCGSRFATVFDARGTITKRYNIPEVVVEAFGRVVLKKLGRYAYGDLADALSAELLVE